MRFKMMAHKTAITQLMLRPIRIKKALMGKTIKLNKQLMMKLRDLRQGGKRVLQNKLSQNLIKL